MSDEKPALSNDATHAIWQDPTSYDYAVHGPPYLKAASGPFDWRAVAQATGESMAMLTKDSAEWVKASEDAGNMGFLATLLGATRYSFDELGALLAYLRGLATLYQTYHWKAKGQPAYGDHLLFERLYNDVLKDIDTLAERLMGISPAAMACIDPRRQAHQVALIVADLTRPFEGRSSDLDDVVHALNAEMKFLALCDLVAEHVVLSRGTDNLLAGLQDRHEANIYLLNQRSQAPHEYSR